MIYAMNGRLISEKLFNQRKYYVIFILISTIVITYLHYSTVPAFHDLHNMFAELYYIPILAGALAFGLKGAIVTYVIVSVIYVPHIVMNWSDTFSFIANKLSHALFSGTFAFVAGYLVDREKKRRERAEKERYLAGLGQAAAAIVHDLKNPLISILGFANRIQKGKGDIETASQAVINSAEDMQMIVYDVLDFAKPTRMKYKAESISNIIQEACNYCLPKAESKNVKLSIHTSDTQAEMAIDRSHMKRALINLINNAIDASTQGESVIINASTGEGCFIIGIRDYGEGMDKETLENVFIPFYSKKSSGTGLGMAIAKKIIEGHKGNIRINSQPGFGTEVIIELRAN